MRLMTHRDDPAKRRMLRMILMRPIIPNSTSYLFLVSSFSQTHIEGYYYSPINAYFETPFRVGLDYTLSEIKIG